MCLAGSEETLQPSKPSFLHYFEQKEKEANAQNDGINRQNDADNRRPDGDLQVVSSHPSSRVLMSKQAGQVLKLL